ncbi:MAG TPA: hypothetical protein ENN33_00995 [Ignavibacteria bacterium]|nr:hypothetical protein [Ignavibacteria bacterium]
MKKLVLNKNVVVKLSDNQMVGVRGGVVSLIPAWCPKSGIANPCDSNYCYTDGCGGSGQCTFEISCNGYMC